MTLKSDAKFEKKTDSWFQKWNEEFSSRHFCDVLFFSKISQPPG